MNRTETLIALAACIFASVAAVQVPGRLIYAAVAIALLLAVAGARLRAALMQRREPSSGLDAGGRAQRIRDERRRRLGG